MQKFWDLFERSVILQSLITLVLIVTVAFMYAAGKEVPAELYGLVSLVLGYYFGAKVENSKYNKMLNR